MPELSLTTRDLGDFDEPCAPARSGHAGPARPTLRELQAIAYTVEPYLGARDFSRDSARSVRSVIISDTFHEFSEPLLQKLWGHSLFANRFELRQGRSAVGIQARIRGQKERIVSGFKSAGFPVAAMGDSLNDMSLLRSCDLLRALPTGRRAARTVRGAPLAVNLDEALAFLDAAAKAEENGRA